MILETETGEGEGYTKNFPLHAETTPRLYMETIKKAAAAINEFHPDYLVLSLGFDTYESDPIGGLGLHAEDYNTIGKLIADNLKYPTVLIQEGGYNVGKLEILAKNFLTGYNPTKR